MKDRIKQIRKDAKLTQPNFGALLGVSQTAVTNWETGFRDPSQPVIETICTKFGVNREWLVNGAGEPYKAVSDDEKLAAWLGEVMASAPDDVRRRLIKALSEMPPDAWQIIEQFAAKMAQPE